MCVTSMISGTYMDRWPVVTEFPAWHWPTYQQLMEKARLYDEMAKQKDCPDPKKEQWASELERFMRDRYGMEPKA